MLLVSCLFCLWKIFFKKKKNYCSTWYDYFIFIWYNSILMERWECNKYIIVLYIYIFLYVCLFQFPAFFFSCRLVSVYKRKIVAFELYFHVNIFVKKKYLLSRNVVLSLFIVCDQVHFFVLWIWECFSLITEAVSTTFCLFTAQISYVWVFITNIHNFHFC